MNFRLICGTLLVLISLTSLTACETVPEGSLKDRAENGKVSDNQQSTDNQQSKVSIQITDDNATAQSDADMAAYKSALKLGDMTFCDKIMSETYKTQCQTDLSDNLILKDALNGNDAAVCEKSSSADRISACKIQLEAAVKTVQLKKEQVTLLEKDRALVDEIAASGDMGRCKEISDVNLQQSCEANIIVDRAIEAKDETVCDQSTFENIKADCKELVKQALSQ